jgi:cell fate (sporulation/competence/biofilm development) regulator YmcA (YheA/YmcA/DUF963 family)
MAFASRVAVATQSAAFKPEQFGVRWDVGSEGVKMAILSESESTISRGEDSAASNDASQLDTAGEAILKLLHKAAGVAEANSRRALETAQKLSSRLRAAEDRIAELEAEVHHYREKSERAEEWLRKISTEIEDRLVNEPEEKRRQMSRRG